MVPSPARHRPRTSDGRYQAAWTASRPSTTGSTPGPTPATKKYVSYRLSLGMGVTHRATGWIPERSRVAPRSATRSAKLTLCSSRSRRRCTRSAASARSSIPTTRPASSTVSRTAAVQKANPSAAPRARTASDAVRPTTRSGHRGSRSPSSTLPPGNRVWPATKVDASVRRRTRTWSSGRSATSRMVAAGWIGTPSPGIRSRGVPVHRGTSLPDSVAPVIRHTRRPPYGEATDRRLTGPCDGRRPGGAP